MKKFLPLIAAALLVALSGGLSFSAQDGVRFQWDITSLQPPNILPGGKASARASDGSKITITGSGTFSLIAPSAAALFPLFQVVTGGGTFEIRNPAGSITESGTFLVTRLVRFEEAPGTFPGTDRIGNGADARGGLVVLQIVYSDGRQGTLVVSCHLAGTPDSVFEGITATKGFVDFFNAEAPVAGVDADRTLFHVLR